MCYDVFGSYAQGRTLRGMTHTGGKDRDTLLRVDVSESRVLARGVESGRTCHRCGMERRSSG